MSHEEENNEPNSRADHFGLPGDYFQQSAVGLLHKMAWLEEHREFPVLLNLDRKAGFTVPGDYFNRKEQQLELQAYPLLAAVSKQSVFAVPLGYFEEQEVKELAKVIDDHELQTGLGVKQSSFIVAENYFSENAQEINKALISEKRPAKIIRFARGAWMAAAALLVMALGFWLYELYAGPAPIKDCGTIACVDKKDLLKSKSLESLDNDELYDLVNSKKLEEKLNTGTKQNTKEKSDSDGVKDSAVDDLLLDEI